MLSDKYMLRCIELASQAGGKTHPNPLVGALVVHQDSIIGEGYHHEIGGPHAEVNAIKSVADKTLLKAARLYVTLEPCNHFGKTPPCTDLIIESQIQSVLIANEDPNPMVNGSGIKRLQAAGIKVTTGLNGEEAAFMNRRFLTFQHKKRPYVILKWAESSNKIIGDKAHRLKISAAATDILVHKWRFEEHAVLVGYRTALLDNPMLNDRLWMGREPLRVVIDRELTLPKKLNLFRPEGVIYVLNSKYSDDVKNVRYRKLDFSPLKTAAVLNLLALEGIISVMVEGGAVTLNHFIQSGLYDECRIIRSDQQMTGSVYAPVLPAKLPESIEKVGNDQILTYFNS